MPPRNSAIDLRHKEPEILGVHKILICGDAAAHDVEHGAGKVMPCVWLAGCALQAVGRPDDTQQALGAAIYILLQQRTGITLFFQQMQQILHRGGIETYIRDNRPFAAAMRAERGGRAYEVGKAPPAETRRYGRPPVAYC